MTTKTCFSVALLLGLVLGLTPCLQAQALIVVAGRIYDADTQTALPGLRVSAAPAPSGRAPAVVETTSRADGTYSMQVAPGKYVVCVDAGKQYLDPCVWSRNITGFNSAAASTLNFPLQRGVLLAVHVQDPTSAAAVVRTAGSGGHAAAGLPAAPQVSVILRDSSGTPHLAPFTGSTGTTSEFSLLVPPNASFSLSVESWALTLADGFGNPLAQNMFGVSLTSPGLSSTAVRTPGMGPAHTGAPSAVYVVGVSGPAVH
jgi:hypothetical protein